MCRSIHTLFNLDPPATDDEIRAASRQYVRKLGGSPATAKANEATVERAIDEIAAATARLLAQLDTRAPARSREDLAAKARQRSIARFGGR